MRWEHLTSLEIPDAVAACGGVAVVPVGVIEPHGAHLPLGTDMLEAHWSACHAAEQEPALVFPPYPFGINHESAHLPGAIVFRRDLVFALLENVCDELARNGVVKIVLLSGHGGNRYFLPLFVQTLVEKEKGYVAYYHFSGPGSRRAAEGLLETRETGHACERETSVGLHMHPELVQMDRVPSEPFHSLRRNETLRDLDAYSPVDWYAMYPAMYVGDASRATAEKGRRLAEARVADLVALLRAVKEDSVTPELMGEFLEGSRHPAPHDSWARRDESAGREGGGRS